MFKKNRNIKTFKIHKLLQDKGKFIPMHKRVSYTKFKNHYGINKTNRCIGYTPDYIGPSPSKIVSKRNYVMEFIRDNMSNLKKILSYSCYRQLIDSINEERVVYGAGFTSCSKHLKEYLKDNTTEDEWSVKNIFNVLENSNFKWFRAARCSFNRGRDIFNSVSTNPNAFSGHYTSILFGPKKCNSNHAARQIAYNLWDLMKTTVVRNFYLWTILGREKDIKINTKVKEEVGTRVVLTTEHPMIVLLCWFAQKISYVVANTTHWDCRFNITGEFDSAKYARLVDKESQYDYILEADWTFYDSNIDTNFLIAAGLLICSGMPEDQLHRNIRYLIISSIVTKYIAIPPGVVVELNRAQPSGHPFGTLVNCYVNLIYWSIIGQKIYGDAYHMYMDVEVYGDDTRAYFKDHPNLLKIDEFVEECGLKSDSLLGNFRPLRCQCDTNHQIDYLKRRFDESGIIWNHKKMFDKMLYPSKNRDINDQFLMVCSWSESVPTDKDALLIASEFGKYIKSNHSDKLRYESLRRINEIKDCKAIRSTSKFHFENRIYDINKDYENEIIRLTGTIFFIKDRYCKVKDIYGTYLDHTHALAYINFRGDKNTKNYEFDIGVFGRDPPMYDLKEDPISDFKKNVKSLLSELKMKTNSKFRKFNILRDEL